MTATNRLQTSGGSASTSKFHGIPRVWDNFQPPANHQPEIVAKDVLSQRLHADQNNENKSGLKQQPANAVRSRASAPLLTVTVKTSIDRKTAFMRNFPSTEN
ncbi:hypothetical protein KOR42_01740 [Thalassoglobus neptunius]|uniref:Uncharacterized protein n=1 Tax=Thalassoglobus neptunius TaxID=1938619 RepID=A0A5C5X2G6_9PLAN|nr:hypothetical protein KOR42_01740 [Thalassoglobus neptunius]